MARRLFGGPFSAVGRSRAHSRAHSRTHRRTRTTGRSAVRGRRRFLQTFAKCSRIFFIISQTSRKQNFTDFHKIEYKNARLILRKTGNKEHYWKFAELLLLFVLKVCIKRCLVVVLCSTSADVENSSTTFSATCSAARVTSCRVQPAPTRTAKLRRVA